MITRYRKAKHNAAEVFNVFRPKNLMILEMKRKNFSYKTQDIVYKKVTKMIPQIVHYPANNAMQGPCGPCKGCPYGTRTDLAAGTTVAPLGLTARVS